VAKAKPKGIKKKSLFAVSFKNILNLVSEGTQKLFGFLL